MRLKDHPTCRGTIVELSLTGNLFVVGEEFGRVKSGTIGRMRFALPTSLEWLEPLVVVKRASSVPLSGDVSAQAFDFEFKDLTEQDERTVVAGCEDWAEHRTRTYPLAARCIVEGLAGTRQFKRPGRLVSGSRERMHVRMQAGFRAPSGLKIRLVCETTYISATVLEVVPAPTGTDLVVALDTDWGRDFFLHDARRQALALVRPTTVPRR